MCLVEVFDDDMGGTMLFFWKQIREGFNERDNEFCAFRSYLP